MDTIEQSLDQLRTMQAEGKGNDATKLVMSWRKNTLEELDRVLNMEGAGLVTLGKIDNPDAMYKELVFFELYQEGTPERDKHAKEIQRLIGA